MSIYVKVMSRSFFLVEAATSQVIRNDYIRNCIKYELDVVGIGCTRLVTIYLLRGTLILGFKLCLDIRCCFFICLFACTKTRKWVCNMFIDLLCHVVVVK